MLSRTCGCSNKMERGCHVVQQGETLWEISQKYQVPLERLIRVNPRITNPDMIFPGQVISIP